MLAFLGVNYQISTSWLPSCRRRDVSVIPQCSWVPVPKCKVIECLFRYLCNVLLFRASPGVIKKNACRPYRSNCDRFDFGEGGIDTMLWSRFFNMYL